MFVTDTIDAVYPIGSVGLAALALLLYRLRGTTLVAAGLWAGAAWLAVVAAAAAIDRAGAAAPLRWCAGMALLCPTVSLLGAKRPQHVVWQWIVLSLWVVLAVPAAQAWLAGGETSGEVHPAWLVPVAVLLAIGPLNYLPTRRCPAALAWCAGQVLWLAPWWPVASGALAARASAEWSLVLLAAGLILAALDVPRGRRPPPGPERLWYDFRQLYGVLWSLRLAEQVNRSARASAANVELGWRGASVAGSTEQERRLPDEVARPLVALLPRFVSSAWVRERLADSAPSA